jgi:hypothetical protein
MENDTIPSETSSVQIVRTFKREGVTYDFYTRSCSCCGELLYFVGRTDGARISCFQISEEKADDVEQVIDDLHESFAVDIEALINCLKTTMDKITSKDDFRRFLAGELSNYRIRTLDRARLILKRFSAEGKLEYLEANADTIDDDLVASFTLGYLASENWWTINHEDAVFEGYRQQEAREVGRPLAVDARLRIGRRSRQAVINAARELYKKESRLRRNDSKAAALIAQLKLPELRKHDGTFLGNEAIIKHLRAARDADAL